MKSGLARDRIVGVLGAVVLLAGVLLRAFVGPHLGDTTVSLLFLLVACLLLFVVALLSEERAPSRTRASGIVVGVLVLVVIAARALFTAPFDSDAPVLRAVFSSIDVFGDWNHPFLPYLLSRPATWISFDPRVLRVVPFFFLCVETALATVAATRDGGPLAGALCGVWFACEIPRRHGLRDLGDWDIAGTFLMALVLWTQRRDEPRTGAWFALGALIIAGVFSSWLMIVPAGVLVLSIAHDALRKRVPLVPVVATAVVVVALALLVGKVFVLGHLSGPGHAREVLQGMATESPIGRSSVMGVPFVLGLAWTVADRRNLSRRFALGTLIAVPLAIEVSFLWSHVNGGYYVGLVTPLCAYVMAVATSRGLFIWLDSLSRSGRADVRWIRSPEVRGVVMLAVGLLTVDIDATFSGSGWEDLPAFSRQIAGDPLPILTNAGSLARLIGFARLRAGVGTAAEILVPPPPLAGRILEVREADCSPVTGRPVPDNGFYLAHSGTSAARAICLRRFGARCHSLQVPADRANRIVWFYRCDALTRQASEASAPSATRARIL